jgi:hypothetical protein
MKQSIVYDNETGNNDLERYSKGESDVIATRLLFRVVKILVVGLAL